MTTESDEQPVSMSELYPLQISPVSSYAGEGCGGELWRGAGGRGGLLSSGRLPCPATASPLSRELLLLSLDRHALDTCAPADRVSACVHVIVHTFPCMANT